MIYSNGYYFYKEFDKLNKKDDNFYEIIKVD